MIKKCFLTYRWVVKHPLNRGAGGRALYQFGRAQVGARLLQREACVPFPNLTYRHRGARQYGVDVSA